MTTKRAAIAKYREFHRKDPRKVGVFPGGAMNIPRYAVALGDAAYILYRSDKVDPSTLRQPKRPVNYIHDHEAGVICYEPTNRRGAHTVEVPDWIIDAEALTLLGASLGFAFTRDGDRRPTEVGVTAPYPELYCTPCGRALLVVQSKREVLAAMWGGMLGVEARGIVG